MSLDVSKLENVRERSGKVIARCPACAEAGHDQKGEHLFINEDGRFGCVVYSGDEHEAREHRRRIFVLSGDRTIKRLVVRQTSEASLSRTARTPFRDTRAYLQQHETTKVGLLKRLGRCFAKKMPANDVEKPIKTSCDASCPSSLGRQGHMVTSHNRNHDIAEKPEQRLGHKPLEQMMDEIREVFPNAEVLPPDNPEPELPPDLGPELPF